MAMAVQMYKWKKNIEEFRYEPLSKSQFFSSWYDLQLYWVKCASAPFENIFFREDFQRASLLVGFLPSRKGPGCPKLSPGFILFSWWIKSMGFSSTKPGCCFVHNPFKSEIYQQAVARVGDVFLKQSWGKWCLIVRCWADWALPSCLQPPR